MERTFSEALKNRRSYYSITGQSPVTDQEIECIVIAQDIFNLLSC